MHLINIYCKYSYCSFNTVIHLIDRAIILNEINWNNISSLRQLCSVVQLGTVFGFGWR